MKKTFLLLLFYPSVFFSQNYEIVYNEYFIALNGGSLDLVKEKLIKVNENKKSDLTGHNGFLLYSDGVSLYSNQKKVRATVDEEKSNSSEIHNTRIQMPDYYKNQNSNLFLKKYFDYNPNLYGEDILITDKLPKHDWELTNIKENVSGYTCKLAKTVDYKGNSILIWYTDEIPINDGPREFWGLPGLIIQLQINEAVLVVAKSIKKLDKKIDIKKIKGGNIMNIKEFSKLEKELDKPGVRTLPDGTVIEVH